MLNYFKITKFEVLRYSWSVGNLWSIWVCSVYWWSPYIPKMLLNLNFLSRQNFKNQSKMATISTCLLIFIIRNIYMYPISKMTEDLLSSCHWNFNSAKNSRSKQSCKKILTPTKELLYQIPSTIQHFLISQYFS